MQYRNHILRIGGLFRCRRHSAYPSCLALCLDRRSERDYRRDFYLLLVFWLGSVENASGEVGGQLVTERDKLSHAELFCPQAVRSEERRVGKEWTSRGVGSE